MLANAVAQITAEGLFTKRISEYLLFFLKVALRYPQNIGRWHAAKVEVFISIFKQANMAHWVADLALCHIYFNIFLA